MTSAVLLHDLADPDAGEGWRAAIEAVVGAEGWTAPDLPGHGYTPAPRTGAYDPMAVVTWLRRQALPEDDRYLVIGVGHNAHAALVLAAGDGCGAVVIVDGLHGHFRAPDAEVRAMYATLRAVPRAVLGLGHGAGAGGGDPPVGDPAGGSRRAGGLVRWLGHHRRARHQLS